MDGQLPEDAWLPPVLPKPPRGVLVVVPGRLVVGVVVVVVVVVVDTRVGVGVVVCVAGVRENAGRDQWLELLVRVQLDPVPREPPPLPQERRG